MPTYDTPVAAMNYFSLVDPTGGNRRRWQDFSSTRTLLLRWRPHPEKLSALDLSHNQTEETVSPRTHSRAPTVLIPHPRDKQEQETAEGTVSKGRTSRKATVRRTPALPQPDNIAINPAFRIEFSTVQREAYPCWPIMNPRCAGRLRVASSGQPNMTSD
ncbi:uncharacterized protein si:dkeyp-69c1.9 [Chelmon rostratus]|uniref:uncharacterized protein si:dkeyp-69c1.9 n=1 Tax=Chelmon rostratus TaxID=109905 RepID=UPI001BEBBD53|nr:uncharacterized protein si:dkeyp-69c1.9 [Chelmon rostratus]